MSPEQVPPFPKARNKSNYGKNCDKCRIAADTSEKEELEYKSQKSVNVRLNFAVEEKKKTTRKEKKNQIMN